MKNTLSLHTGLGPGIRTPAQGFPTWVSSPAAASDLPVSTHRPLRHGAEVGAGEQGAGSPPSWAQAVGQIHERGTGRALRPRGPKEPAGAPMGSLLPALTEAEPHQPPSAMVRGLPGPAPLRRPPGTDVRGWEGPSSSHFGRGLRVLLEPPCSPSALSPHSHSTPSII